MRKNTTNTIITLIAMILIISSVAYSEIQIQTSQDTQSTTLTDNFIITNYGLSQDFQISSKQKEINFCACENYIDILTLENKGMLTETYKITFDKKFSKNQDLIITINPNEKITIPNYIDLGCNEISKDMVTLVESTNGKSKILTQKINSKTCNNIKITNLTKNLNITPCQKTETKFLLSNPLSFAEEYTISLEKYDTLQNLTEAFTILKSGEQKNVTIIHNLPCNIYGNYDSTISISTTKTKLEAEIPVNLNIARKYDYDVTILSNEVCLLKEEKIAIKINNNENFSNSFDLTLLKNKFYNLENTSITLNAKDEKIIYLTQKEKPTNATLLNLELITKSKLGKIEKIKKFNVSITNCFAQEITKPQKEICKTENQVTFTLKNSGEKKSDFLISSKSGQISSISQTNFSLFPKEQRPIILNLTDSQFYNFDIEISQENGLIYNKLPINITKVNDEKCYNLSFMIPDFVEIKNNTYILNITLKNNGLKDGSYELLTDKTGSIDFIEQTVNIRKDNERRTFLRINPKQAQNQTQITFFAKNKETNITYQKIINLNENKESKLALFKTKIKQNFNSIIQLIKQNFRTIIYVILVILFIIIIITLITLAIIFKRNRDDKKKKLIVEFYNKKR